MYEPLFDEFLFLFLRQLYEANHFYLRVIFVTDQHELVLVKEQSRKVVQNLFRSFHKHFVKLFWQLLNKEQIFCGNYEN